MGAVDIDDDALARPPALEFGGSMRSLRNVLIGDTHRKRRFLDGNGASRLLQGIVTSSDQDDRRSLVHATSALASLTLCKEAIPLLLQLGVCDVVRRVITAATSSPDVIVLLLRTLHRLAGVADVSSFKQECVQLCQRHDDDDRITSMALQLLSGLPDDDGQGRALVEFAVHRLEQLSSSPSSSAPPYMEFFHSQFLLHPHSYLDIYPNTSLSIYLDSDDRLTRLRAIQCIVAVPKHAQSSIPEYRQFQRQCLSVLSRSLNEPIRSQWFDEECASFSSLIEDCPSFAVQAQPLIAIMANLPTSAPAMSVLAAMCSTSETTRTKIVARLDLTSLLTTTLMQSQDIFLRQVVAVLIRNLSRSVQHCRVQLFALGSINALFDALRAAMGRLSSSFSANVVDDSSKTMMVELAFAVTVASSLANLMIHFDGLPRPTIDRRDVLLLITGTGSKWTKLKAYSCWALKNLLFNVDADTYSFVMESLGSIWTLLNDSSIDVQLQAVGLVRNIFHPVHSPSAMFQSPTDHNVLVKLLVKIQSLLGSPSDPVVLESLAALSNIAAGARTPKVALLNCPSLLNAIRRLFDHSWSEVRLYSIVVFENLFCRSTIFKKKRSATHRVPIEDIIEGGFKESIELIQKKEERLGGNADIEARASKAVIGMEKTLHVLLAVQR